MTTTSTMPINPVSGPAPTTVGPGMSVQTGRLVLQRGESFSLPPRGRLTTWIISNHDGQQLGHVVVREADKRLEHVQIDPEYRRVGYATEAVAALAALYGQPLAASAGSSEGRELLAKLATAGIVKVSA